MPAKIAGEVEVEVEKFADKFIDDLQLIAGDEEAQKHQLAKAIKKMAGRLHVLQMKS